MRVLTAAVFISAVLLVSGDSAVKPDPEPLPTVPAPNTTTTQKPTEPTTLKPTDPPKPPTTPPTTTSTTTAKTTTTTKATTTSTTEAPKTTPSTTTSTTTTTAAPPTPVPDPTPGKWVVDGKNSTCIVLHMAAQFNVTYVNTDNKTVFQLVTVPSDNSTKASGVCDDEEQEINLKWMPEGADSADSIVMHFKKNDTKSYSLHHFEVHIASLQLPKFTTNGTVTLVHKDAEYKTALTNSYRCMRGQVLKLEGNATGVSGVARISELQFQAFKSDKLPSFGYAEDCTFETQDVVPIAVGCALIALVVIVLVAYLIGRRRSQARGYVSM